MPDKNFDTVIVGGGIIGLFTAWELSKAGQQVCIIDRSEFGQEASWAAGGILSPLRPWQYPDAVNRLALWSQARYQSICEELKGLSGIDCEWQRSGMLLLDCPEIDEALAWGREHDQEIQQLDLAEVYSRFPGLDLSEKEAPVCWLPNIAQVRNPRLIKALVETLRRAGVEIRANEAVLSLDMNGNKVTGVKTDSGNIASGNTVVAAGAWSGDLLPKGRRYSTIRPVKGQMLLYTGVSESPDAIIMSGEQYLVPRSDGSLLVGSSVEESGFDQATDAGTKHCLLQFAEQLLPGLKVDQPLRHWSGLRPATEDEVPVIGPDNEVEGLFINAGHYRSGIVMAPASAHLCAQSILGASSELPVEDYQP